MDSDESIVSRARSADLSDRLVPVISLVSGGRGHARYKLSGKQFLDAVLN
jgi:hypothetical protein